MQNFDLYWNLWIPRRNIKQITHSIMPPTFVGRFIKKIINMMKPPDMVKAIWNMNELGYNIFKRFQFISKHETTYIIMCTIATNFEQTKLKCISLNFEYSMFYMFQQLNEQMICWIFEIPFSQIQQAPNPNGNNSFV